MASRRSTVSFQLPPLLRTKRDRAIAKPFLDAGRLAYGDYGWNLSGRRDVYLTWIPELAKITIGLLKALDRCQGGEPSRDHREARMPAIHKLILSNIAVFHGHTLPNGRFDKLTTSLPLWVAATPDGSPLGWVPEITNRANWVPGKIRIYKGWRLTGVATEVLGDHTRAGSSARPGTFYDEGFVVEPKASGLLSRDPADTIHVGPVILRHAYVCACFSSLFGAELFDDRARRQREQTGEAWAIAKREAFRNETLQYRPVMPSEAGTYVCMADEAVVLGRDVSQWSQQLVLDLWHQRSA